MSSAEQTPGRPSTHRTWDVGKLGLAIKGQRARGPRSLSDLGELGPEKRHGGMAGWLAYIQGPLWTRVSAWRPPSSCGCRQSPGEPHLLV